MRPRLAVEKRSIRRYTLGKATFSRGWGESGPKKMTVGCVMLTRPRRNSVSQAVVADTASARIEMVMLTADMGVSTIPALPQIRLNL